MTQVNLVQLDRVSVQVTCNVSPFNSSSDHWVVSLYNNDTFSGRMMMRSKKKNQGKQTVNKTKLSCSTPLLMENLDRGNLGGGGGTVVLALISLYCTTGLIPDPVSHVG